MQPPECYLLEDDTRRLINRVNTTMREAPDAFTAAREIAPLLGAHMRDGRARVGFWAPEIAANDIAPDAVFLEVLTPTVGLDFSAPEQTVPFYRQYVPLIVDGEYVWGIIDGMIPGGRERTGTFYRLAYHDADGGWHTVADHLAYSVPFGVQGPAEFYDVAAMLANRADAAHFRDNLRLEPDPDGMGRIGPPVNILQIHAGTASPDGTLAGLTRIYRTIADKVRTGASLSPAEQNYIGYDAIQLMPIEPPIEHENGLQFWEPLNEDPQAGTFDVLLRRHDIIDWGYDVMISASPAVNPALLASKRPDELLDLIETLHNFPGGPIGVIFDVVYGHTDNQALSLMDHAYLAGSNMYGQNLNYTHPTVRAILLEMQRRKHDYGVDGVRVDGAQDFKYYDAENDVMIHDDDYLRLMNDVVQEAAGVRYRPWMIFEDGRPWPRDDWELSSTYREVTRQLPNVWQWGPLTFAHNTPFLFTFWLSKWWRIEQIAMHGREWITGCANHDTLRRGTQVDLRARINTYLGHQLPEILGNAYDNAAAKLFDYAMMPGVPMDFINAAMRAPWSFFRNTDDRYGVKVVADEHRFLEWAVRPETWDDPAVFARMKAFGFTELADLSRFMHLLDAFVSTMQYDLPAIVRLLNNVAPAVPGAPFTVESLKQAADAWMWDVFEYVNVSRYADDVDPVRSAFNYDLRQFRRERPWLMDNLRQGEYVDYVRPADGATVFYGLRRSPDDREWLLFIANMEGEARAIVPAECLPPDVPTDGWRLALNAASGEVHLQDLTHPLTLHDSQGVVYVRGADEAVSS